MDDEEWINEAKERLAKPSLPPRRAGSIAARVETLIPEIAAARAGGKTWAQIADDLSSDAALNIDSVRIGYGRATARMKQTPSVRNRATPQRKVAAASASPSDVLPVGPDLFEDMFAPMLDARDMLGRGADGKGEPNA